MTELATIPVPGTDAHLSALRDEGGTVWTSLRHACAALDIDHSSQARKLRNRAWATVVTMTTVGADGKVRDLSMIDRRTLTMWLALIDPSRVSEDARPRVEAFQVEAADALDAYFHAGGAVNPAASDEQLATVAATAEQMRAARRDELLGSMSVLHAAKGLVSDEFLETRARLLIARELDEEPEIEEGTAPLSIVDYLRGRGVPASVVEKMASPFGRKAHDRYIADTGGPRGYRETEVRGSIRRTVAWTDADRPLLDAVWRTDPWVGKALAKNGLSREAVDRRR